MRNTPLVLLSAVLVLGGCSKLIGLDEFHPAIASAGAGGVGGSAAGNGGAGGDGGTGAALTGGAGGTAGVGGGTGECSPGKREACYDGPAGTENVGICKGGQRFCDQDGNWSTCEGEQVPTVEDCSDALKDENCDRYECGIWGVVYGQSAGEPAAAAARPDRGMVIAGTFSGGLQIEGESRPATDEFDVYIASLDASGKLDWLYTFGNQSTELMGSVAVSEQGDVFSVVTTLAVADFGDGEHPPGSSLIRLSPSGQFVSSTFLGEAFVPGLRVRGTHVYLVGFFNGSLDWGTGPKSADGADIVVAKLGLDGAPGTDGWVNTYGSPGNEEASGIDIDAAGYVYVTGAIAGEVDFGNGAVFQSGPPDGFLLKLDAAGKYVQSTTIKGIGGNENAKTVAVDATGAALVTGLYTTDLDVKGTTLPAAGPKSTFLIKYDSEGSYLVPVWGQGFPNAGTVLGGTTTVDSRGAAALVVNVYANTVVGGETIAGNASGLPTAVRFDQNGNHLWHKSIGGSLGGSAFASAGNGFGEVFVLGTTDSPTLDIGTGTIAAGQGKSFVVKLGR
ncbi:MAG: hypothetical protein R3B07_24870 [Polyangiaceae bacterium]